MSVRLGRFENMLTVIFCGVMLVVAFHFAYAATLVLGYLAILIGWRRKWEWTRNVWFRFAHLAMILVVVTRVFYGGACPLTTLEKNLRQHAGMDVYEGEFLRHYIQETLGLASTSASFHFLYTAFFLSVLSLFFLWPPRFSSAFGMQFASRIRRIFSTETAGSMSLVAGSSGGSTRADKLRVRSVTSETSERQFNARVDSKSVQPLQTVQIGTRPRSASGDHWN